MNKHFRFLLSLGFLLLFLTQVNAQKKRKRTISDSERFSAGLVFGYNSAQIDGDYFTGFDKYGITGGIRGITRLTPRLDFNIEMLYSKKGSKIFQNRYLNSSREKKNRIIDLSYMDVPFFFKWMLDDKKDSWHIELGFIYSRLIDTKITENVVDARREFVYQEIVENFDKDDISYLVGFGYTWNNGIALNMRYNLGAKKFYKNKNYEFPPPGSVVAEPVLFLRNYYYSLNLSYTLFKEK